MIEPVEITRGLDKLDRRNPPDRRNIVMFSNIGEATKDEQQSRIVTTMSLRASTAGIVTGFLWQQSGTTVVFDRTKMSLTVRRLRLGQSHA